MAIDTRQKRMSALCIGGPQRGALVDASEVGFTQGNRQAAAYLYSGILAGGGGGPVFSAIKPHVRGKLFIKFSRYDDAGELPRGPMK